MKHLLFFSFTLFFCGCSPTTEPLNTEAEKTALSAAAENYYQLMNDNNWEGLEAIYSKSGQLIPDKKDIITGEAGIQNFVDGFRSRVNFKVSYEGLKINMAKRGDMGYSIATVTTTFQDSLGNDFGGVNRDLHIWKKEDGKWKILVDIWNTPPPLSGTNTN